MNFTILKKDGCWIEELKNLNDFSGELSIKNLENVKSLEEAENARLHLKKGIHKLCLMWSKSKHNVNYDIL